MKCRDFEQFICDRIDQTLSAELRAQMDEHRIECSSCAEAFADAEFAHQALSAAPALDVPADLIADIIHDTVGVGTGGALEPAGGPSSEGGFLGWFRPLFHPLLQPRFVMGMAMTALSASMMSFYGGQAYERWQDLGTTPTVAVERVEDRVDTAWDRAIEVFEAARDFYQIQTGSEQAQPAPEAAQE